MAQAPTTSPSATVAPMPLLEKIQRMQRLQTEIREFAGSKDQLDNCVKKIQDLSEMVFAEYEELVACEQRDTMQIHYSRLQPSIQTETQKLYEKSLAKQTENAGLWLDQKSRAEDEKGYAIKAAKRLDAEDCQQHVAKLLEVGIRISDARDRVSQQSRAKLQHSGEHDPKIDRNRRIEENKKGAFAHHHHVVELSDKANLLFQIIFQSDESVSLEARNAQLLSLMAIEQATADQVQREIGCVGEDTCKILWRMDALMTFYNDCVELKWQLDKVYPSLTHFHNLLTKEHLLSLDAAPHIDKIAAYRTEYEMFKAEMAKTPQFPGANEFYTYADAQQRPATADKKPPEFDQLKIEAIKKQLADFWILAKGRADWLCCKILDARIGYLSKLLAQEPNNADLAKMLQKDMEERLTFFSGEISALGTKPSAQNVANLLAKADELKKGLPYTNQAERFNTAVTLLSVKQSAMQASEFAANIPAKLAELRQVSESLKAQIVSVRAPDKAKPVLSLDETTALDQLFSGLDNSASLQGQMKRLVDLKFAHLKIGQGKEAWVQETLKRCYYSDAQAKTQVPALTSKLSQQYSTVEKEIEMQRKALTTHPEWLSLNQQIRNEIAKPLNIIADALKAKGFKPEAEAAQNNENLAWVKSYTTRYTQWWDNGHSHAPKQAATPASPTSSSPENTVSSSGGSAPTTPDKNQNNLS